MPSHTIASERFRPLIIQALLLPVIAMIAFGAVLIWRITHVLTDQWWVYHTEQVIENARQLNAVQLRAQGAIRGFLLTSDKSFRDQFEHERSAMEPGTEALQRLVADNSTQVARAGQIREVREQWLQLIDEELDKHDHGGDWLSIVKSGVTSAKMRAIEDQLNAFVFVEQGLRHQRVDQTRASFKSAGWIAVCTAIVIGLTLAFTSRRQLGFLAKTYDEALREASEASEVLERRVAERTAELEIANRAMKAMRV